MKEPPGTGTVQRDRERLRRVLAGRFDGLPLLCSRTVRVFISSTFSDMLVERNVLMERVYPKLKDFCKHYGLEFQVVDMRWGVREEAQDDHMTSELCVKEIHKCQRISVGPTFVTMFGQKYGYRPFPATVGADEFEMLHGALLQAGKDSSLLRQWFRKDENRIPPVYSLVPISSRIPDYVNKEDLELQNAAREEWQAIHQKLQVLLRIASDICYEDGEMRKEDRDKYFISVTEDEIRHGTVLDPMPGRQIVFARTITDLEESISHPQAVKFIDLTPEGKINSEAQELLHRIRDEVIPEYTQTDAWKAYAVEWSDSGGINTPDHNKYLQQLCDDFYELIKKQTINNLAKFVDFQHNPLVLEVLQHLHFCSLRTRGFQGREDLIEKIQKYVAADTEKTSEPFVIHGESGSGKTSLIAVALTRVLSWMPEGKDPVIIVRFLGTTPKSSGIFTALQCICLQIAENYKVPCDDAHDDFQELVSKFWELLKVATAEKPLIVLMDSLDQLSPQHQPARLTWLPCELPPHVKLIVSTLPEDQGILGRLKDSLMNKQNMIEVPPLGNDLCLDLINSWLKTNSHVLTPDQMNIVKRALKCCSLPLYTKLVYEEVIRWKSYSHPDNTVLELTVKGIINQMIRRLEVQHGKLLVSHGLAYLTAARNGLSEVELEDVLSLDDAVLDEIFTFWVPPIRRIPPLLWTRIRDDISSYLVEREADGVTVLSWHHRQFRQVMHDRYLKNKDDVIRTHSALADYYMGRWSKGKKKPFRYSALLAKHLKRDSTTELEADRKISPQPLKWKTKTAHGVKVEYNLRKLSELPYHLYMAGRHTELLQQVFYNYKWLHTKLRATSLTDLLSDLALVHRAHKGHRLEMLSAALRVAGSSLRQLPNTLASEIIGRLKNATSNRTSNGRRRHRGLYQAGSSDELVDVRDIESFLTQVQTEGQKHCSLLPTFQCFDSPIEALSFTLEGHRRMVTDMHFSSDSLLLYSLSLDGNIIYWDTKTGEPIKKINAQNAKPGRHAQLRSADGTLMLETYADGSPLYVYDEKSAGLRHELLEKRPGYYHDTHMSGPYVLREGVLFDLNKGQKMKEVPYLTTRTDYAVTAMTHNRQLVLVGEQGALTIVETESGEILGSFPYQHSASSIAVTRNDTKAVIGYRNSCIVEVRLLDRATEKFAFVAMTFDYKARYPHKKLNAGVSYSQDVTELVISRDSKFVLVNITRHHLFVLGLDCGKSAMMDMSMFEDGENRIHQCGFSTDNITVIALVGRHLCLWNAYLGSLLAQMQLTAGNESDFFMSIAPSSSLVAIANKRDPIINLWDIHKLQEPQAPHIHTYNNPLNVVVLAPKQKLAFIKVYHPETSRKGQHYKEYFGIDVWNLATNHNQKYLPFGNYGSLVHMETSLDGHYLVLLTEVKSVGHVFVIDLKNGNVVMQSSHTLCYKTHLSPDGEYLLMESSMGKDGAEVMIWQTSNGTYIRAFDKAKSAVFSSDSNYVICLKGKTLTRYSLKGESKTSGKVHISHPEKLQTIPNRPDLVLVTGMPGNGTWNKGCLSAVVWDITLNKVLHQFDNVAPSGFIDFSKNGELAVDGWLQVFDLDKGDLQLRCSDKGTAVEANYLRGLIKITYDGKYVLWADTQPTHCLKVFRMADKMLVAEVGTHSQVLTLSLTDFGYSVVVGCEDGRILTFQLHSETTEDGLDEDDDEELDDLDNEVFHSILTNNNVSDMNKMLSKSTCSLDRIDRISSTGPENKLSLDVVDTFDVMYRKAPLQTADCDLPVAAQPVKDVLEASARFAREIKGDFADSPPPRRANFACCLV